MDQSTLEAYRQSIINQQQRLIKRIYSLEEELHDISAPEISFGDRSLAEEPEEVLKRLDERDRRETEDIQAALDRIDKGAFGQCESCRQLIERLRLDALPTARYCMHCQKQTERTAKER